MLLKSKILQINGRSRLLSRVSKDKFSKTISLPVETWAHLEQVRIATKMPDLAIALQDCIDAKYDSILLVRKLEETRLKDIEQR